MVEHETFLKIFSGGPPRTTSWDSYRAMRDTWLRNDLTDAERDDQANGPAPGRFLTTGEL